MPKRSSRYGVGKEIGGAVYVHRAYENVLPVHAQRQRQFLDDNFDYTVVKYMEKSGSVSFIFSPDFDTVDEPTVGDLQTVSLTGKVTHRKQLADPYIYHHKWLFVQEDYTGFNVEESKQRSRFWLQLPGVDKSRVGRKSYWERHVLPRLGSDDSIWLSSGEMASRLRVSSCELSHLRRAGRLPYRKHGNAFLYRVPREQSESP